MAEGARLESVCVGNCTEGSNPSLSAIFTEKSVDKQDLNPSCLEGKPRRSKTSFKSFS